MRGLCHTSKSFPAQFVTTLEFKREFLGMVSRYDAHARLEIALFTDPVVMETWQWKSHFITDKCTACTICERVCPTNAITSGEIFYIDPELCINCSVCGVYCPFDAIDDSRGVTVARMHIRSLERFPFDSVLLPYNYVMMQNAQYSADFERLAAVCAERGIAMQTIKGLTLGPWNEKAHTHITWYEPLSEQADIDRAVHWVLGRQDVFLNTSGDLTLLPRIIDAAERLGPRPSDGDMDAMVRERGMAPLFV